MDNQERTEHGGVAMQYIARLRARNKRISLLAIGTCAVVLVVALSMMAVLLALQETPDDGKILSNVYVADVNLGGMTKDEARSALQLALGNTLSTENMVVTLPDDELVLSPLDTQAFISIDDLVTAAYQYGRDGTKLQNKITRAKAEKQKYVLPLLDYMYLDLGYIRQAVMDFCDNYTSIMTQSTVILKGERPDYHAIIADNIPISAVKHQVLQITIGSPQFVLDANVLYDEILDAYSLFDLNFTYAAPTAQVPDPLDAQQLFDTYCVYPADAYMDGNTYAVTPEVYGYGFDVTELARLIHRAEYGDTFTIKLDFLYPDITEEDLNVNYFQDVLASYTSAADTPYNADRLVNLQVACAAINGMILKPGETFDFNMILGPRTTDTGYKSAPTYSGSSTNIVGGGISQIASVLRYCAMVSGLQIKEYHTHAHAVSYTPMGTDAAISYGTENLVFTNTTANPIQIFVGSAYGAITVNIMGTEQRNYIQRVEFEVTETLEAETVYQFMTENNVYGYTDGYQLQSGLTGYVIQVYSVHYDLATGEEISRTLVDSCSYSRRNEIIIRIEQGEDVMNPDEPQ